MIIVEKTLKCFLVAALAGCVGAKDPTHPPANPRVVRWVLPETPPSLDWTQCSHRLCLQHAMLTSRGLFALAGGSDPDAEPSVVPSLVESWSAPDRNKLRFLLKPQVRWSNGSRLVSAHFLKGWESLLRTCRQAWLPIRGARAFCEGKGTFSEVGIKLPDDRTIEFELERPAPLLPVALAHPSAFPVSFLGKETLSLGPLVLERFQPGLSIRYVANPLFIGPPAAFDRLEALVLPLLASRVQLFLDGGAELVEDVTAEACLDPALKPGCVAHRTGEILSLVFHTQRKPFLQATARSVFSAALQRGEIARLSLRDESPSETPPTFVPQPTRFFRFPVFSSSSKVEILSERPPFKTNRPVLALFHEGDEPVAENLRAQWLTRSGLRVESHGPASVTLVRSPTNRLTSLETLVSLQTHAHWKDKAFDLVIENARKAESSEEYLARLAEAESILVGRENITYPLLALRRLDLQARGIKLEYDHFRVWDAAKVALP